MLALQVLSGPDWKDPAAVPAVLGDPVAVNPRTLRVACFTDNGLASPTPATAETVERAARVVRRAGATVEEARPKETEQTLDLFLELVTLDGGFWVRDLLRRCGTTEVHPFVASFAEIPVEAMPRPDEVGARIARWDAFRLAMTRFLGRYDAILCPVNAGPAKPHGFTSDGFLDFTYTVTFNLVGWPGAVIRCGTSPEGLPIGVQIVTRPFHEDVALAIAARLERELGGWRPPAI